MKTVELSNYEHELVCSALNCLHNTDLSNLSKIEIEALENVMEKFKIEFTSYVGMYYSQDGDFLSLID